MAKRKAATNPNLTKRELSVLKGIAAGHTFEVIARRLDLGYETVRTHAASIRDKLKLRNRSAIAAWAVRNGKA